MYPLQWSLKFMVLNFYKQFLLLLYLQCPEKRKVQPTVPPELCQCATHTMMNVKDVWMITQQTQLHSPK